MVVRAPAPFPTRFYLVPPQQKKGLALLLRNSPLPMENFQPPPSPMSAPFPAVIPLPAVSPPL